MDKFGILRWEGEYAVVRFENVRKTAQGFMGKCIEVHDIVKVGEKRGSNLHFTMKGSQKQKHTKTDILNRIYYCKSEDIYDDLGQCRIMAMMEMGR